MINERERVAKPQQQELSAHAAIKNICMEGAFHQLLQKVCTKE